MKIVEFDKIYKLAIKELSEADSKIQNLEEQINFIKNNKKQALKKIAKFESFQKQLGVLVAEDVKEDINKTKDNAYKGGDY